jgi:hypothetical protein
MGAVAQPMIAPITLETKYLSSVGGDVLLFLFWFDFWRER